MFKKLHWARQQLRFQHILMVNKPSCQGQQQSTWTPRAMWFILCRCPFSWPFYEMWGVGVGVALSNPRCSMYGQFTSIWLISMVNVGKYSIHWASGNWNLKWLTPENDRCLLKQGSFSISHFGESNTANLYSNFDKWHCLGWYHPRNKEKQRHFRTWKWMVGIRSFHSEMAYFQRLC